MTCDSITASLRRCVAAVKAVFKLVMVAGKLLDFDLKADFEEQYAASSLNLELLFSSKPVTDVVQGGALFVRLPVMPAGHT
jgi:hypothetical protein